MNISDSVIIENRRRTGLGKFDRIVLDSRYPDCYNCIILLVSNWMCIIVVLCIVFICKLLYCIYGCGCRWMWCSRDVW